MNTELSRTYHISYTNYGYDSDDRSGEEAFATLHVDDRQETLDTYYEVLNVSKGVITVVVVFRYPRKV